jgi:hypothetical protein
MLGGITIGNIFGREGIDVGYFSRVDRISGVGKNIRGKPK